MKTSIANATKRFRIVNMYFPKLLENVKCGVPKSTDQLSDMLLEMPSYYCPN